MRLKPRDEPMTDSNRSVSSLLYAWSRGDLQARDDLLPLIHHELARARPLPHEDPPS